MRRARTISISRFIPAPPDKIFELLADARKHPLFDGSGTVTEVKDAPERLALGATFLMGMKMKFGYITRNRVVVFEESRAIAWHHFARFIWRYDLEPVEGGTRVTETFDYDRPWGFVIEPFHFPEHNRAAMEETLARLEAIVTE